MRQEPIEKVSYRGCTINIYRDEEEENPHTMNCCDSEFWSNSRRCCYTDSDHKIEDIVGNDGHLTKEFLHDYIYVPVYRFSHSGESVSTGPYSDPWDSGLFGILAMSKERVKHDYGWKLITKERKQQVIDNLTAQVEEYDMWLQGDVYGYMIEDEEGNEAFEPEFCGCWNYYGKEGIKQIKDEAKAEIDAYLARKDKERKENTAIVFTHLTNLHGKQLVIFGYSYKTGKNLFGMTVLERAPITNNLVGTYCEVLPKDIDFKSMETLASHAA